MPLVPKTLFQRGLADHLPDNWNLPHREKFSESESHRPTGGRFSIAFRRRAAGAAQASAERHGTCCLYTPGMLHCYNFGEGRLPGTFFSSLKNSTQFPDMFRE